jgi:hypothetical protein
MTSIETGRDPLSADEFAHLGQGAIAYVKPIKSDDVLKLFPQAPTIQPGLDLYMLAGADGMPILLTDSRDAAIANAWENQLQTVSIH